MAAATSSRSYRVGFGAALLASVAVLAAVSLVQHSSGVELEKAPQITINDLVKQQPEWAPAAAPQVSDGFNTWMDSLPFGDNYHKQLAEKKSRQEFIEKERLSNPHFLLRRVEANNNYLKKRVEFLDTLVKERDGLPALIAVNVNHPGPAGAVGEKGFAGDMGLQGPEGERGPQGPAGLNGPQGPFGNPGVDGPEGAVGGGGVDGPAGQGGSPGLDGLRGGTGLQGKMGPPGKRGPAFPGVGPPGSAGVPGPAGIIGAQGAQGAPGPSGGSTWPALAISEQESTFGGSLRTGFLQDGAALYSDRSDITFTSIPPEIHGEPYILTIDNQKGKTGPNVLSFRVNRPSYVYVLFDSRGTAAGGGSPPAWLSSGFNKLEVVAEVNDEAMATMGVYKSGMPMNGLVELGGNANLPSLGYGDTYVVAVAPSQEHASAGLGTIALAVPSGTGGTEGFEGSMGFTFTANAPIFVLDLGAFTPTGEAPMAATLSTRLYNEDTGELLAEQTFSEDNRGDLKGGSLFKALRQPLSLPAGFKGVLACDGYGPTFMNGNSEGLPAPWTFNEQAGKVTFGSEALVGAVGEMPDEVAGTPGNRFAAGTFRYT